MALANVLVFMFLTTMFLIVGVQFTQSSLNQGRKSKANNQVYNVATAGLKHALLYLQKQDQQPATVFDPNSSTGDSAIQTMAGEDQLGLVHEFKIDAEADDDLWGRYEVGRYKDAPIRTGTTAVGAASSLYPEVTWTAEDVSLKRGATVPGEIWRVRSRGYVFARKNDADPFALPVAPKPALPTVTLEAEIKFLRLAIPKAALYSFASGTGEQVLFDESGNASNTLIDVGTSGAVSYWTRVGASQITTTNAANVSFQPALTSNVGCSTSGTATYVDNNLNNQLKAVFGVKNVDAVTGVADYSVTSWADLPATLPPQAFIYVNPGGNHGTLTFNDAQRLKGSGILFVDGNLALATNGQTNRWEGLIFTTGTFDMQKDAIVIGSVITGGRVTAIRGATSKKTKLIYSEDALERVQAKAGGYRMDRSTMKVFDGATPAPTF